MEAIFKKPLLISYNVRVVQLSRNLSKQEQRTAKTSKPWLQIKHANKRNYSHILHKLAQWESVRLVLDGPLLSSFSLL